MQAVILGCGTAAGTPRIGNDWGACDPDEARNRRRRASILIRDGDAKLLIDASPDLRQQALDADFDRLSAVLFTHAHADHAHGIDDLRFIAHRSGDGPLDCWADPETLRVLQERFAYTFEQDANRLYPPILNGRQIVGAFEAGGIEVQPFRQGHGPIGTLGFRFGKIAYSTDVQHMPEEAFGALEGVETWIVDCLQRKPHPTHAHLDLTLEWIERVKPKRAILTHMNSSMDYRALAAEVPDGVEPAFDGMVVEA